MDSFGGDVFQKGARHLPARYGMYGGFGSFQAKNPYSIPNGGV